MLEVQESLFRQIFGVGSALDCPSCFIGNANPNLGCYLVWYRFTWCLIRNLETIKQLIQRKLNDILRIAIVENRNRDRNTDSNSEKEKLKVDDVSILKDKVNIKTSNANG